MPKVCSTPKASSPTMSAPAIQGYGILRVAFVLIPIASGLDKFFDRWPWTRAAWIWSPRLLAAT